MKFFILSFSIFLIAFQSLSAQTIRGKVILSDGKPAAYATVTLHNTIDSALVKGALTGEQGDFELNGVVKGRYYATVNVVGAGKTNSPAFDYAGGDYTLETIAMRESGIALKEVTVTTRRPTIEVQADKTVLNVEGTVNSTGLSALELLRKAPGVTVDNNENVSVRGKNGVRVMIDGREVPLDGKDLAAQLKGMQAADIANIEIISNPSAKYDASGNAGIINIKLRRNKALGTNGNIGLEGIYGKTAKGGMNLSLNHRAKKVALFGTYNNSYGRWHNENYFYREQNGLSFDQAAMSYNDNRWNSTRSGVDWFIDDRHTVGVLFNGNFSNGNWFSDGRTAIGRVAGENTVDSLLIAQNNVTDPRNNVNFNLNYRFADTTGHSFNFDADRGTYRIQGNSLQPNFYRTADNLRLLNQYTFRSLTPTDIDITTVKADYEQKLWKGKFGAGVKVADIATDNTFDFYRVNGAQETKDLKVSNQFLYEERTSAAYVNYQRTFGKLNVQAGLRMENTRYSGDLIAATAQNGERISDEYTEWFPSAALTMPLSEKLGLNLTYSRRIDRPSYQDLNPFEFRLDELTYQKGNPRLRPQFTHSIELSPTYQGQPAMTLGYSRTRDLFTQILDTTNVRASFITQENIADQENYSLTLNAPTPIAKWWEGFVSITGVHSAFSAEFREGFTASQKFNTLNFYSEQTIRLPKGFSIQVSGWYNSPGFWGTLRSNAQGMMEVGVKKKLFDGKGELRLRLGDVLGTAGWKGENLFTPGLLMTARGTWEARTATLNFSYRFGSADVKSARQRKTGLDEEGQRVKGRN